METWTAVFLLCLHTTFPDPHPVCYVGNMPGSWEDHESCAADIPAVMVGYRAKHDIDSLVDLDIHSPRAVITCVPDHAKSEFMDDLFRKGFDIIPPLPAPKPAKDGGLGTA